jgi:hypothetical protein
MLYSITCERSISKDVKESGHNLHGVAEENHEKKPQTGELASERTDEPGYKSERPSAAVKGRYTDFTQAGHLFAVAQWPKGAQRSQNVLFLSNPKFHYLHHKSTVLNPVQLTSLHD